MYDCIMSDQLDMPIWTKGVNFKAYRLAKKITLDDLKLNLNKRPGNYEKRVDGWLTEETYFPRFKTTEDLVYFIYMHFARDGNASRVQGNDVWRYHPVGCAIDLKNNLIIVSTSSQTTIKGLVEDKMFEPIRALANIDSYNYNGDFLFWLLYIFDKIPTKAINGRISIEDVKAVTNKQEIGTRSNAAYAGTQVTEYTETKVILGLSGFATGIKSKFNSNSNIYEINLYIDGRIIARNNENLEETKDKTLYAIDIHKAIQESFSEYDNFTKKEKWSEIKKAFQLAILTEALETLKTAIGSATNN